MIRFGFAAGNKRGEGGGECEPGEKAREVGEGVGDGGVPKKAPLALPEEEEEETEVNEKLLGNGAAAAAVEA